MVKLAQAALFAAFLAVIFSGTAAAATFEAQVIPEGKSVDMTIGEDDIALQRLSFRVDEYDTFRLRVWKVESQLDWVYDYFNVDAYGFSSSASGIVMDVSVSKYWISLKNIQTETIALNAYDGAWKRIELEYTGEDGDFIYYRGSVPVLEALFAVTGEPLPLDISITSYCNANGVCEPDEGEDVENCMDCLRRAGGNVCVPFSETCAGDNVMICGNDGTQYELVQCASGCSEGECVDRPPEATGTFTGLFAAENGPFFMASVAVLTAVIAYLTLSLKRTRETLSRVERIASSKDDLRSMAERRKD